MLFHDATEKLGLHPFMGPLNINTEPYDGRPACTYCGFCMFFGCWNDAKGSTLVTTVPKALASGNVDISTFSKAVEVEVDDRGEVASINYLDANHNLQRISARAYVLAAYTFENVRLCLLSKSRLFPNELGNNRSLMGKYFLTHIYQVLAIIYDGVPLNRFAGPQGQRVVIDDFNGDNFDHSGLGFISGAQIFAHNEFHPISDLSVIPPDVPAWGRAYKEHIARYWNSTGTFLTNTEVLPYEANYLDLDDRVRDPDGLPVIRVTFKRYENEIRLQEFIAKKMEEIAETSGASKAWRVDLWGGVPSMHDCGGTRMGHSADDSVVDSYGRMHDVPNLFVLGQSTFPTITGLNPTLTAQALAWRSADHIIASLNHGSGA